MQAGPSAHLRACACALCNAAQCPTFVKCGEHEQDAQERQEHTEAPARAPGRPGRPDCHIARVRMRWDCRSAVWRPTVGQLASPLHPSTAHAGPCPSTGCLLVVFASCWSIRSSLPLLASRAFPAARSPGVPGSSARVPVKQSEHATLYRAAPPCAPCLLPQRHRCLRRWRRRRPHRMPAAGSFPMGHAFAPCKTSPPQRHGAPGGRHPHPPAVHRRALGAAGAGRPAALRLPHHRASHRLHPSGHSRGCGGGGGGGAGGGRGAQLERQEWGAARRIPPRHCRQGVWGDQGG